MNIEYGTEVVDKDGNVLGTVNTVVRNSWTGEISKFMVRRKPPEKDLFVSLEYVLEATDSEIKLSVSLRELNEKE
jgi:sporulation protein YlmC with PRC-barrel domain